MSQQVIGVENCASEPIRIPGGIQPHGALLVADPGSFRLLQISANATEILGPEFALGADLRRLIGPEVETWFGSEDASFQRTISLRDRLFAIVAHLTPQGGIFEFEPVSAAELASLEALNPRLRRLADNIVKLESVRELAQAAAREIRRISGFNRVLVYSFDPEWHGTVIAEDGDGVLPSYLDLRFPASDIPAQARELYRLNPIRLIPSASYVPAPLVPPLSPVDGQPLDLSFAALRSVSPVHLEYMRNMGTLASMSMSILVEEKLWGLISCHNAEPRQLAPQIRAACDFAAKLVALRVGAVERGAHAAQRIRLKQVETDLVARLARADDIETGLVQEARLWLSVADAQGAAIVAGEQVHGVGTTPSEAEIREIADWLRSEPRPDTFATDFLAQDMPGAERFAPVASGLIAASISQLHSRLVLWFRPEVIRTVTWGGDPHKPVIAAPGDRLRPRTSFGEWQEQVRNRARPWSRAEVESAEDFRNALINFVLLRAEEQAALTDQLERSNRELEAFSYSVSHDLRAPFRHIVGYAELLRDRVTNLDDKSRHYLGSITEAALAAGQLVDDLLAFSQLGRASIASTRVDMRKLVDEVRRALEPDMQGRNIVWEVDDLPPAWGDASLLRQALSNLIENAVKYSRGADPARIVISGVANPAETVYSIADNGVGFDMTYVDKLFGVFQRLHRAEDFEGTGIGLALTKRVIDRHGGWIRAEGKINHGAIFTFALPRGNGERGRV